MIAQMKGTGRVGADPHHGVSLTPQARRLLEGPVLATLLRMAAPTVALMLLQGVIAAGEERHSSGGWGRTPLPVSP